MLHAQAANIQCDKYCSNFLEIGVQLNKPKHVQYTIHAHASIDNEISAAEHFAILKSEPLRTYSGTLHFSFSPAASAVTVSAAARRTRTAQIAIAAAAGRVAANQSRQTPERVIHCGHQPVNHRDVRPALFSWPNLAASDSLYAL